LIEVVSPLLSERDAPALQRRRPGAHVEGIAVVDHRPGSGTALIEPSKFWQNGVAESFNGKFRDECRSLEWFRSRDETREDVSA
jgi:putative transposase